MCAWAPLSGLSRRAGATTRAGRRASLRGAERRIGTSHGLRSRFGRAALHAAGLAIRADGACARSGRRGGLGEADRPCDAVRNPGCVRWRRRRRGRGWRWNTSDLLRIRIDHAGRDSCGRADCADRGDDGECGRGLFGQFQFLGAGERNLHGHADQGVSDLQPGEPERDCQRRQRIGREFHGDGVGRGHAHAADFGDDQSELAGRQCAGDADQ